MYNMSLIGKRITVEQATKEFPNRWIALKQCNFTQGGRVLDGILLFFCTEQEMDKSVLQLKPEDKNPPPCMIRTTIAENAPYGW